MSFVFFLFGGIVWMNMFVGLCLCVRKKIMRSEERKKEKEEKKKDNPETQ